MAKRIYPTYWSQWISRFAIKPGNKFYPPEVIYVEGVNQHGYLVGVTPNTNIMYVGKPWALIEYSPRLFVRLEAAWKIKDLRRRIDANSDRLLNGR